jgi:hypothetical protein
MSVGTRQFVLPPDSKSSFLHGGRIASVIKELQGEIKKTVLVMATTLGRGGCGRHPRFTTVGMV